jgi:hypothetical protein
MEANMFAAGQVSNELERCVIEILEAQSDAIIRLSDLQTALDARLAARAPGPASLIAGIQRRPDLFMVLAHSDSLPGAETWPRELRARYDAALSDARLRAETHIGLKRDVPEPRSSDGAARDVLRVLQHSVLRLWRVREKQPALDFDGAVSLFDTVRSALHSSGNAE